jgi:hypothetical protein
MAHGRNRFACDLIVHNAAGRGYGYKELLFIMTNADGTTT